MPCVHVLVHVLVRAHVCAVHFSVHVGASIEEATVELGLGALC